MIENRDEPAPFPGADATDTAAEQIIPPEQAPMDDAAGGPQAEDADAPFDDGSPEREADITALRAR